MKKFVSLALVCLMAFGFVGCKGKKNQGDDVVCGGWGIPEKLTESSLDENLAATFAAACKKTKKNLTPQALLGTQVVSGTNYAFLCKDKKGKPAIAIVYEGFDSSAEIISVKELDVVGYAGKDTAPERLSGGWTIGESVKANKIALDAENALRIASGTQNKINYEPIALLGQQVVAGMNYLILCKGTANAEGAVPALYILRIYNALDGSAEITSSTILDIADFRD
ncbi:MAG: hypothetical protein MJ147_09630 [Clostridia bacterium]|nr:hypothetical protein [Clostridia bacterium]